MKQEAFNLNRKAIWLGIHTETLHFSQLRRISQHVARCQVSLSRQLTTMLPSPESRLAVQFSAHRAKETNVKSPDRLLYSVNHYTSKRCASYTSTRFWPSLPHGASPGGFEPSQILLCLETPVSIHRAATWEYPSSRALARSEGNVLAK